MKTYYIQYRYDTMKDASCGVEFQFKAEYMGDAISMARERVSEMGCQNPHLVAIYDHNPTLDEVDRSNDNWKKYHCIHIDESLENDF